MKHYYIACTLATLLQHVNAVATTANGVTWQLKPYIFKNENNEMDGIIYKTYEYIQNGCFNANKSRMETLLETVVYNSLADFDKLLNSREQYDQGNLTNVTQGFSLWLPIVKEYDRELIRNRSVTDITLLYSPNIAVVVKKSKISLFYKLQLGIQQTYHIVVISVLCAIIFAILIWIAERWNNPEFSKTFVFGFGTGLWWAFVTMTTVGYGDVVPRSFVGRCTTVVWMIIGLVSASLMTAAVSDVVLGVDYIDLKDNKVASIESSYEAHAINNNYKSEIIGCQSYEEILDKVRDEEVFAGIIPSDIVGYMPTELDTRDIVIPIMIDIEVPVKVLEPPKMFRTDKEYMKCKETYLKGALETYIRKYRKYVPTETLHIETLEYFFSNEVHVMYYSIAIAALVVVGILYDVIVCGWKFNKKRKSKNANQAGTVIGNNNLEMRSPSKDKAVDNGAWRNGELQRMRQDITLIKENITKISAMTKYKKTCNICAWER